MVDTPNLLNRWARSWVFKIISPGHLLEQKIAQRSLVLAWRRDLINRSMFPRFRNDFRGFGLQVLFQLHRIVRVCLGNVFNWHLSLGTVYMKILNSQLLLTQVAPHCSAEIVVCVDSVFLFIYEDSSRDLMIAEREEIINPMIVGPTPGLYRLIRRISINIPLRWSGRTHQRFSINIPLRWSGRTHQRFSINISHRWSGRVTASTLTRNQCGSIDSNSSYHQKTRQSE